LRLYPPPGASPPTSPASGANGGVLTAK
jgi:hypothetical protein